MHYWQEFPHVSQTDFSMFKTVLPVLWNVLRSGAISLRFWETSTGCQLPTASSSKSMSWLSNPSTVLAQYTSMRWLCPMCQHGHCDLVIKTYCVCQNTDSKLLVLELSLFKVLYYGTLYLLVSATLTLLTFLNDNSKHIILGLIFNSYFIVSLSRSWKP